MFKKIKGKLHLGSPGRRSPSTVAGNKLASCDTLLSATGTTLQIAKASVAGLPVPGLEAAVGGLLTILTLYQGMKANDDAIKAFNSAIIRLNDNIATPLTAAIAEEPDFLCSDLRERLELLVKFVKDLVELSKRADTLQSREKHKRFFSSQDDLGIIQGLNRDLDRAGRGSIGAEMEARKAKRLGTFLPALFRPGSLAGSDLIIAITHLHSAN
ncbi:hypothetical protein FRC00_011798, partial [Tulasnella sp. 408]